jgi:hypothetical protein
MTVRAMYIWKLAPVIAGEGSVTKIVEKARRAKITSLWVKIADGKTAFANVKGATGEDFLSLIEKCREKVIQVWGWQVPHSAEAGDPAREVQLVKDIAATYKLDGLIMDAEGGGGYFQGDKDDADSYSSQMRALADGLKIPLGVSSNDIPANLEGWLPKFNKIASHATINFPQTYYGESPSVLNRIDRAENANRHVTLPFCPVGAAWIGDGGGCSSASACAERARTFIDLCHERQYELYSFWHWGGAPLAFWEVLNTTMP